MLDVKFSELVGKTIVAIEGGRGDDTLKIRCSDGTEYRQHHSQDCCESVDIDDIVGDLADVIGSPVLAAEESSSDENPEGVKPPEYQDSFTWTFYKIDTAKGGVTIRWYGASNGYYSERVDFTRTL